MPIRFSPLSFPSRARGSIGAKLRRMVWLMVLPTLLLSVIAGLAVSRTERRAVVNAALETVEALSLVTDREMAVRTAMLQALSVSPSLQEGRLRDFHREASRLADGVTNTIVLLAPDGQQLLNTRLPFGEPLGRSPAFASGMPDQRRFIVSDLFRGPVDDRYTFAVRIPVMVQGRPMLLGYGSPASELQQIFRDQPLPAGWLGVVLDGQSRVVARTRDPEQRVGQVASETLRRAIASSDRGVVDSKTLDGVPVFTVFSRAPDSGWVVLIGLEQSELAHSGLAAFGLTLALSVGFILITVGIVRRMARDIVEPLQHLSEDAVRLGSGETVRDRFTGLSEIDTVHHALATASLERAGSEHRLRAEVEAAVTQARQAHQAALRSQKLEALGRLTGGIAHDFNNLLQTMTTGLDLARRLNSEPRGDAALAACQRATGRAAQLTRQLLAFGRQQVGHEAVIDLRRQLPELMELVTGAVGSAVELHASVDDALWPVKTDPVQLELAVLNLALNARDAMHGRGRLSVTAANCTVGPDALPDVPAGDYVCIRVIDTGDGMNAEQISRAFEPFFTTKPVGQGSGLGLAQVYALAKSAGGVATIHSQLGLGTEVAVWLPRSTERWDATPAADSADPARRYNGRVMLVEDETSVRELTAQALEALGFEVVTAPTADQALDLLRGGTAVDVVLSDIVMPGTRSGVDLARTLRVLKPTLAVVLASGHPVRIEEAPDVPLVAKPYEIQAVAARLAEAMNQAGAARAVDPATPGT